MVSKVEQARAKAEEAIKKAEAAEATEAALGEVRKAAAARLSAHRRLVQTMREAHVGGAQVIDIMKAAGVSRQTFYNWCIYGKDEDVAWRVR